MRTLLAVFGLFAALPGAAAAQRWVILDAGAGSSRHQLGPAGSAVSVSPRVLWLGRLGYVDASGVYTRGTALGWNAEVLGSGGVLVRPLSRLTLDLGAEWVWTGHRHGKRTSEALLRPTARLELGKSELSVALAVGRAALSLGGEVFRGSSGFDPDTGSQAPPPADPKHSETRSFSRGTFDGVTRAGPFELRGRITRTRFGQRALRAGALWNPQDPSADTLFKYYVTTYDDALIGAGWSNRLLRLTATVEQRFGQREFRSRAWHLEGAASLTRDVTLFGATGRTLSRLTVDVPARGYATAGLRWTIGPRKASLPPEERRVPASFRVEREGDRVRLAVRAIGLSRVEVMGDFTDWEPVLLTEEEPGWWALTRTLAPGLYRINVRYDGGPWLTPPGLPSEEDGFGGRAGVILVS